MIRIGAEFQVALNNAINGIGVESNKRPALNVPKIEVDGKKNSSKTV